VLAAGCGAKELPKTASEAPRSAHAQAADPTPDRKTVVTGVVRKDGSRYLLWARGRNYVLIPGRCDPETARKAIDSRVGKMLTVRGEADRSKLRVNEVKG
jgi:hypothetical protein